MNIVRPFAVAVALLPFLSVLGAQTPAAPPAEAKKLSVWVGDWKYEGDAKASPMGPAAKIAGTQTGRIVMNGFFLEWTGGEKGALGAVNFSEMDWYDAAAKSYAYTGWQSDGSTWAGSNVVTGNTWKFTGTQTVKGVVYKVRGENVFAADGMSETWKTEISADGKTWALWTSGKMTKAK
jgi:hypothetical protein